MSKIDLFQDIMNYLTQSSNDVLDDTLVKYMVETKEWNESEAKLLIDELIKSSAIYVSRSNHYAFV